MSVYDFNATFQGGTPVAPVFLSGNPANGSSGAPRTGPITLTFSTSLAVGGDPIFTLQQGSPIENFNLTTGTGDQGGTCQIVGSSVIVTPAAPLAELSVTGVGWNYDAVRSSGGVSIVASRVDEYTFTTSSASAAATLTNPSATALVGLAFDASCDTDTPGGTIHWMLTPDATPRSVSTITKWSAKTVTGSGTQSLSGRGAAGLSGNSRYVQFVQKIGVNYSNVLVTSTPIVMNGSGPYTMEQMRECGEDLRLTQPDWMTEKRAPKRVNVDPLPAGCTYSAANHLITIPGGVTASFDGWDFRADEVGILVNASGVLTSVTNCRFGMLPKTPTDRWAFYTGAVAKLPTCITLTTQSSAQSHIGYIGNCVFDMGGGGVGCGASNQGLIRGLPLNSGTWHFPSVDLIECVRLVGFTDDAIKGAFPGERRAIYYDVDTNIPMDAEQWDDTRTYQLGETCYGPSPAHYPRMCRIANTTAPPDFSAKLAGTPEWTSYDPHTDHETCNGSDGPVTWRGCYINRDRNHRMFKASTPNLGNNMGIYLTANAQGSAAGAPIGDALIEYCVITSDIGDRYQNHCVTTGPALASAVLNDNFYSGTKWIQNTGGLTSETNNQGTFAVATPATITGVSAGYNSGVLTYQFDADRTGWMNLLVSQTNTLTDTQVWTSPDAMIACRVDETGWTEEIMSLASGTYYVHGLFEAGGQTFTRALTQTIVVP